MLKFPKQIMKLKELVAMGFPEEYLRKAYGDKNQTFASKMDPTKENSSIIFDTNGFGEWWLKQIQAQSKAMQRR